MPSLDYDRVLDIEDRYVIGTRLRLRKMTEGTQVVYKLARKLPEHEPGALVMGNLYLSHEEYQLLLTLPARTLCKTRHKFGDYGVDVFEGALQDLVTAEIEDDDAERLAGRVPPFDIVRDITDEPAYRGANLAAHGCPRP